MVGNVLETSLKTLYYQSKLFQKLRNRSLLSQKCENCKSVQECRGGLKCLSYSVFDDPLIRVPGCLISN